MYFRLPIIVSNSVAAPAELLEGLAMLCDFVKTPEDAAASISFRGPAIQLPGRRPSTTFEYEDRKAHLSIWSNFPCVAPVGPFVVLNGATQLRQAKQLLGAIEQFKCGVYAYTYIYEVYNAIP